jgi:hypothetical protein
MIALYILLGIVLFFALIFSLNIKVFLRMEDELSVRAGVGPVVITVKPEKKRKPLNEKDYTYKKHQKRLKAESEAARKKAEKKAAKKAAKAEKAKKRKEADRLAKEAAAAAENRDETKSSDKLGTILSLVEFGVGELGKLASSLHTDIKSLDITVGGPDAATIALNYGKISSAAAILIEFLDHKTALRRRPNRKIRVEADFCSEKTVFKTDLSFKLRIFSIVRAGWHALVWFVKRKLGASSA